MLISVCCAHRNTQHVFTRCSLSAEENRRPTKIKFTVHVKKKAAGKLQTEKGFTPFFEKNLLEFLPILQGFIVYIFNLQLFLAH